MSSSTFYYQPQPADQSRDEQLATEIEKIIEQLPEAGYRPVTKIIRRTQLVNHKRVHRIMKERKLLCRKVKHYATATTDSQHRFFKYENLAKRMAVTASNQLVVADVTAYNVGGKDHYLASIMDRFNREIIGRAVSDKNDTELVLTALEDAQHTRGSLRGCVHHSDADVRYCSAAYIKRLREYQLEISMCVGNAYENAHIESFNKTIKRQEINVSEYESKEDSAESIFHFIGVYNSYRPHSALDNLTPIEFELANKKSSKLGTD
jgi:putative transposase